jgi:hypothetical protein
MNTYNPANNIVGYTNEVNDSLKEIMKLQFACIALMIIYIVCFKYFIYLRKQEWKKASDAEIIAKLLEILYLSDYYHWFSIVQKQKISYSDIRISFNKLDSCSKMKFWKYCSNLGLREIWKEKIIDQHE